MGSSGGDANPMFLSQGSAPIPNIPIAGQAGELKPHERGTFQNFLPEILAAGQGPNPSATGLTTEMLKYRSPQGVVEAASGGAPAAAAPAAAAPAAAAGGADAMRNQLAAIAAEGGGEFANAFGGATNTWGGGNGDFGGWGGFGGGGGDGAGGPFVGPNAGFFARQAEAARQWNAANPIVRPPGG